MVIYKTTNLINNKIYIGQTSRQGHSLDIYLGSGTRLALDIKKYGKKNFKKEIIEICGSIKQLNEREIFWINYFNSTNHEIGYNVSIGGHYTRPRPSSGLKKDGRNVSPVQIDIELLVPFKKYCSSLGVSMKHKLEEFMINDMNRLIPAL